MKARRRSLSRRRKVQLVASAIILASVQACVVAHAAESKSSKQATTQLQVKSIHIAGSRAFSEAQLLRVIQDGVGKQLNAQELDALGERLTAYYRQHGFSRAHAILPPQDFSSGAVRFLIVTTPAGSKTSILPKASPPSSLPPQSVPATRRADPVRALLDQARLWRSRRRFDLAQEALDKLSHIAPNQPDGLAELAELQILEKKNDEVAKSLARLRQVQPDHPAIPRIESLLRLNGGDRSKLQQIRLLASTGNAEAASVAFRKLFPNGPPDQELALEYWQMLGNTRNGWIPARKGLAQLAKDNPLNIRYRLALAELDTSRQPISPSALQVLINLSSDPTFGSEARSAWRGVMMRLSPGKSSVRMLREYLDQDPEDTEIRDRLASFERADSNYQRMLANPAYQAKVAGLSQLDAGNLDAASQSFEYTLARHPHDPDALGGMGKVRLRQGRHAEAQSYFELALRYNHADAKKWHSLINTAIFWGLLREAGDALDAGKLPLADTKLNKAMSIEPREPYAIALLADLRVAQGRDEEAERAYHEALRIDPLLSRALNGLIALYIKQGRVGDANQVFADLAPAQRSALGSNLGRLQAGMLRDEADRSLADGNRSAAMTKLERAAELDPDDPWLRLSLARLYAQDGKRDKGQALFDVLLARHPDDAEDLYAQALYQSGQDENLPALTTLQRVPEPERTSKMTRLQRKLWVDARIQQARQLISAGQQDKARQRLIQVESAVAGDTELTDQVAYAWADLGNKAHARKLVASMPPPQTPTQHLEYARTLARIGDEAAFKAELGKLSGSEKFSGSNAATLTKLRETAAIHASDALLLQGKADIARQTLAPFLAAHPDELSLLYADARISRAKNELDKTEIEYRHILQIDPAQESARQGLISTLIQNRKKDEAAKLLDDWLAANKNTNPDTRLDQVGLLIDLGDYDRSRNEVSTVLALQPNNTRALDYAGQIARHDGRIDDTIKYLQHSMAAEESEHVAQNNLSGLQQVSTAEGTALSVEPAPNQDMKTGGDNSNKTLAQLLDQRTNWLSSAMDLQTRSGIAGISQLYLLQIPNEWRTPWRDGEQLFLRTDIVQVNAGALNLADTANSHLFGTQQLCLLPSCQTGFVNQSAQGTSLSAGYSGNNIQADIGTTPMGFPVWNLVGGISKKGDLGAASYSVEASRRPVTTSLLSYAGTRDPLSGKVWGGVVATGVRFGLNRDDGGTFGFWSSLGLHTLTGYNVQSNNGMQLMGGGYWRAINENDRLLSVGLTGMDWHFRQDSGEYTFGQGGYYSPQTFQYLSIPVTWADRYARFSYMLQGSVSVSWAQTSASPYFPTDSALQAKGLNPFYSTSSGPGTGYSLGGSFEYQVTPQLFAGGVLDIQRSQYYAPNHLSFFLRYAFDHTAAKPVPLKPEPVIPYSQF